MCSSRRSGRIARRERCVMSTPFSRIVPGGRLDQPQRRSSRPSTCRCPTRRRARASRRGAARTRRRRPRARSHPPPAMPRADAVVLDEVATSSADAARAAFIRARGGSRRRGGPGRTSAARARSCARARRRAGSGRRTRTSSAARAATAPGRGSRAAAALASSPPSNGSGIAPSRPIVYGCCGCAKRSRDRRLLRPCARRTSRARGRRCRRRRRGCA